MKIFPSDIYSIPTTYHADNFTIPLASYTVLSFFLFMGVFTFYTIRRSNYDLFYWTHHFFMVFFIIQLWHATMSW